MTPLTEPDAPRFVTVDEAKKLLCLGTTAIYDLINTGELRRIKIGRKTVFLASDVTAFINRKVAEADARVAA
jgi:excisionase family DNA binding protein